jgi:hypothetical protein
MSGVGSLDSTLGFRGIGNNCVRFVGGLDRRGRILGFWFGIVCGRVFRFPVFGFILGRFCRTWRVGGAKLGRCQPANTPPEQIVKNSMV